MDGLILISWLNDFTFCPASIYYHSLYGDMDRVVLQGRAQLEGTAAHRSVDMGMYSNRKDVLQGIDVISLKYGLVGKIDLFYIDKGLLVERKKHINMVYTGQIMQMYAQCFALREMGYVVSSLQLRSMGDNRVYDIALPERNPGNKKTFEDLLIEIRGFELGDYKQGNAAKCDNCIYSGSCGSFIGG